MDDDVAPGDDSGVTPEDQPVIDPAPEVPDDSERSVGTPVWDEPTGDAAPHDQGG